MMKKNLTTCLLSLALVLGLVFAGFLVYRFIEYFGKDQLPKIENIKDRIFTPDPLIWPQTEKQAESLDPIKILYWTNFYRQEHGVDKLILNDKLSQASVNKAQDMLDRQYFAHDAPDGKNVSDLANEVGYDYKLIGENLAMGGFIDEKDLVDAWMASPGHRENILKSEYSEIGISAIVGNYDNYKTWMSVQIFGTAMPDCAMPDYNLKLEIEQKELTYEQISALYSEGNSLIDMGNQKIKEGNKIYRETKDKSLAQPYWDEGERLQNEGNDKISQANILKTQTDDLKALIEQYNQQVNDYNSCMAQ